MSDKIFVGKAEQKVFADGNFIIKLSLNEKDLAALEENKNGRGFVNLAIKKSKKDNWYCEIDTFVPQGQAAQTKAAEEDGLPF